MFDQMFNISKGYHLWLSNSISHIIPKYIQLLICKYGALMVHSEA